MDCSRPGFPALHYLPEFAQTEPVILSNHLIFCCPILLLPSIFLSISIFPSKSALCIRWPKYWNSNFNISASNQYSRLISFRIDWFVLLTKSPRDSQESFTAPQFEIISSLVLSLLYDTTHSLELESNLIPCLQDIWPCVCVCVCVCVRVSCSVVSHSLWPGGFYPARFLCPQNSPGKNTRVGCQSLS